MQRFSYDFASGAGVFTDAVATGLWPVQFGGAFHTRETAHRAVATSLYIDAFSAHSISG
jgi:hypothetical protein